MIRTEFEIARAQHLANPNTKKGLDLFEKHIGRIGWLHPKIKNKEVKGNRKYRVINKMGETIFEANKISDIEKEFCLSESRITCCINSVSLIKGQYLVERCGDE